VGGAEIAMKALVTGGGGFLGGAIVRMLVPRGDQVTSFSRNRYESLNKLGVEQISGDIADLDAVIRAATNCNVVFHVAGKAGYWGPWREYYRANVVGTRNVIHVCRQHRIQKLIFTSSPSVVHNGQDLAGINESFPIPRHFEAYYPATKAIAEREILAASDRELATVALRPHLVWGPGDNHLVPRLIDRARKGHLRFVGSGRQLVDVTYIDNAALAHLLAAERLHPDGSVAGKAYFISQGQPVEIVTFINQLLETAGLGPLTKRMNFPTAYAIAWALEFAWKALGIEKEPRLTRFLVRQFATAHWFDISAARRDLGYEPIVSTEEGIKRLTEYYRNQVGNGGGPSPK